MKTIFFFLQKYYIDLHHRFKVTTIINSSFYATLINNNMATVSPIQSHNATRLIFVYKSDVIGVEVYSLSLLFCLTNFGYSVSLLSLSICLSLGLSVCLSLSLVRLHFDDRFYNTNMYAITSFYSLFVFANLT